MNIRIDPAPASRAGGVDFQNLGFGRYFSDHMFSMDYADGAWRNPTIMPYGPVPVYPAASSLHYGQCVFEGLKAFRGVDGEIRVFRPDMNAERLRISCKRLCIPPIPDDVFLEAIDELIRIDEAWIPSGRGEALYIRPLVFSTEAHLDVRPARAYRFLIMTSPATVYFGGDFRSIVLKVEDRYTRAAPGGMGYAKTAGNYAASLLPGRESLEHGFNQVLWLDGREHAYIEEAGPMNIMIGIGDGFVTPPLQGTILAGVTRDSVLALLKDRGIPCEERPIAIREVLDASESGELREVFGCGTAAVICPVGELAYQDRRYRVADGEPGPVSRALYDEILDIQSGAAEDSRGWIRKVTVRRAAADQIAARA